MHCLHLEQHHTRTQTRIDCQLKFRASDSCVTLDYVRVFNVRIISRVARQSTERKRVLVQACHPAHLLRHVSQRVGLIVIPGCRDVCLSVIPRPTAYHDGSITTKFGV